MHDGPGGQPLVYHAHSLTTRVPFLATIEAICKYAFLVLHTPLVLSLEVRCREQQGVIAQMLMQVFGNRLVYAKSADMYSPRDLYDKVLIKVLDFNAGKRSAAR